MFDALQHAEEDVTGGLWVAFDTDEPDGVAIEIKLLGTPDRVRIGQKHSKRRGNKIDAVGLNRELHQKMWCGWDRVTPEWLGKMCPLKWPPAKVAEMRAAMEAEGMKYIPYSDGLRDVLIEISTDITGRLDELSSYAQAVADARDAFLERKAE